MEHEAQKRYPFSVQKHAHDIEFLRNRLFCIKHDIEIGERKAPETEYMDICEKYDRVTDLLCSVMNSRDGRVAYLSGKEIGLAKEVVLWAENERAEKHQTSLQCRSHER